MSKLKLHGFNNLTKTLSFNLYDICFAKSIKDRQEYISYINQEYNSNRLTEILREVTEIIGATILNISYQDYEPQGASVTLLIAEEPIRQVSAKFSNTEQPGPTSIPLSQVNHLDKSHITVHTYPEYHPDKGVCTFRADIDVSTCGLISPLKALNYLIHTFDTDIATMDYRVRGFTRDVGGEKIFIDHEINSIQNFIDVTMRDRYEVIDVNVYQENIFHTKMMLKEFKLDNYLFGQGEIGLSDQEKSKIRARLRHEMLEIFHGRNVPELINQEEP